MKGYRSPSWFRIKGLLGKKQAQAQNVKPEASKSANAKQIQPDLQEDLLEAALPPKIYAFLVEILERCMVSQSDVATALAGLEESSIVDKLLGMMLVDEAYSEIAEREAESIEAMDFRQVLGWRTWHFLLALYKHMISPAESMERANKLKGFLARQSEMLGSIVTAAHQAGDWDTLLLAVGFCQWTGWRKWRKELLRIVGDQIDEQAILDRLQQMEQNPRLLVERLLIQHSRQSITKAR